MNLQLSEVLRLLLQSTLEFHISLRRLEEKRIVRHKFIALNGSPEV